MIRTQTGLANPVVYQLSEELALATDAYTQEQSEVSRYLLATAELRLAHITQYLGLL